MKKLRSDLSLHFEQKLYMSPYLHQMLEILQLPILDLEQRITEELESNPVLELDEKENNNLDGDDINKFDDSKFDELIKTFEDSSDLGNYSYTYRDDEKSNIIEKVLSKPETLQEHLIWQLRLNTMNQKDYSIGERIISNINDRGYLTTPLTEIATGMNVQENDMERVLQIIQTFEPYGVGCRDLRESILIQIRFSPDKDIWAEKIVTHYFNLLSKHKIKEIAHKLGVNEVTVNKSVDYIKNLDPNPGLKYNNKITEYVVPDVIIERAENNNLIIIINDDWIPKLRINKRYRNLLKNKNVESKIRNYLKEKLKYAMLFIKSIEQRNTTLYKISNALAKYQKDFFLYGPGHIFPLTLKDISEEVGVHESTVSRVSSSKYLQTPYGIYNMKYFFSKKIETDTDEDMSAKNVMEIIKDLVENEVKPLSDDEIKEILNQKGIKIARRTISKYRKKLKILPSHLRKK